MTTVVFIFSIACVAYTIIYFMVKENKKLEVELNLLKAENADFKRQCDGLIELYRKTKKEKSQEPEHELQGEFEADDDTYNKIIQEWIYGAEAEEEGGIDGQSN